MNPFESSASNKGFQDFVLVLYPYISYMAFGLQNFSISGSLKIINGFFSRVQNCLIQNMNKHKLKPFSRFNFCSGKLTSDQLYFALARTHRIMSVMLCLLGNISGQMVYRKSSECLLCSWSCAELQPELFHCVELFCSCDNTQEN